MSWKHESVLLKEAVDSLSVTEGEIFVDATLGAAGHAREIIRRGGRVIGFEIDQQNAQKLEEEGIVGLRVVNRNFTEIKKALSEFEIAAVSGVIFDLGISSDQLEKRGLGLSFDKEEKLDMRLDRTLGVSAADLINALTEGELYELFSRYGEERFARHIARAIVRHRSEQKIETSKDLAELIEKEIGRKGKIHPATRVFMALRIVVNDELENLKKGLAAAVAVLKPGGRIVVISFHSLEDRIVKDFFRGEPMLKSLTRRPITPGTEEIGLNRRSRSAKMRVAERVN